MDPAGSSFRSPTDALEAFVHGQTRRSLRWLTEYRAFEFLV